MYTTTVSFNSKIQMEHYYLIEYAFYNDINNTNGIKKSVYFILFLQVNVDDLLMRHACGLKKEKFALLPNKDNIALNDDNHLQYNKKKMGEKWCHLTP